MVEEGDGQRRRRRRGGWEKGREDDGALAGCC
jgi:hypothetical protein